LEIGARSAPEPWGAYRGAGGEAAYLEDRRASCEARIRVTRAGDPGAAAWPGGPADFEDDPAADTAPDGLGPPILEGTHGGARRRRASSS
jgi:hypothetical protein